jgi:hypothetical protein
MSITLVWREKKDARKNTIGGAARFPSRQTDLRIVREAIKTLIGSLGLECEEFYSAETS